MGKNKLKSLLPAIIIFCIALLVRIIYNRVVAQAYTPLRDSLAYQSIAFHMLDEHCYCWNSHVVTVYRPPLWPFLIAGISLIAGRANFFARLFLCFADAGTCVLIYLFARDLFQKRIGLIAGLIACIYPALYIYTGWMYTETLFTFLLMAICYCIFRMQRNQGKNWWLTVLCGTLLALLALTRPNGIVIIGLVMLWAVFLVWRKCLQKRIFLHVALIVIVACVLISPWTVRNYLVSRSFIPVATGDGTVLIGSYNDQILDLKGQAGWVNPGLFVDSRIFKLFPPTTCQASCEVAREQFDKGLAILWIKKHLKDIPQLMIYHLQGFFTPYTEEADMPLFRFPNQLSSQVVRGMVDTFPIPIFLLAAVGLFVTFKRYWRELFFGYLVLLATLGQALVYYGNSRFRTPIEPLLILLAAGAIWWLTQNEPGTLRWRWAHKQQPAEEKEVASALSA